MADNQNSIHFTLANSVFLFQQDDMAELWTLFSPAVLQLKEMEDFYQTLHNKDSTDYDTLLEVQRIIEKALPEVLESYFRLPASGRKTIPVQNNKTAWMLLEDNLILLKKQIHALYDIFFQKQGKHLAILYRKNRYYHHTADKDNAVELENETIFSSPVKMNEQEIYALFEHQYVKKTNNNSNSSSLTSIKKAQWQGITPLQFTGFALAIIVLVVLLGLTLT